MKHIDNLCRYFLRKQNGSWIYDEFSKGWYSKAGGDGGGLHGAVKFIEEGKSPLKRKKIIHIPKKDIEFVRNKTGAPIDICKKKLLVWIGMENRRELAIKDIQSYFILKGKELGSGGP